jgi:hypothetical protein
MGTKPKEMKYVFQVKLTHIHTVLIAKCWQLISTHVIHTHTHTHIYIHIYIYILIGISLFLFYTSTGFFLLSFRSCSQYLLDPLCPA